MSEFSNLQIVVFGFKVYLMYFFYLEDSLNVV